MKEKLRKALEVLLLVGIILLSIGIFLFRDRIGNVGEVGYLGLFFLCFLANATVFLPAPSLMIAASCALIMNPLLVALTAAAGSTLGEFVGYIFGGAGKELSPKFEALLTRLNARISNPTLLVFVLALLPLPLFDVAGVYSGGTRMHPVKFFLACYLGKFLKLLVYARAYDILAWAMGYLGLPMEGFSWPTP